jgi:hypothetical protein
MQSQRILAIFLMMDDRFKMGGQMYRVIKIAHNDLGGVVIDAHLLEDRSIRITLIVDAQATMKIYNQR